MVVQAFSRFMGLRDMITKNAAQCGLCDDIVESKSRHDFVTCSCNNIFIDGGLDYFRAGAKDMSNFISLAEYKDE
jgi:hypothetical protein